MTEAGLFEIIDIEESLVINKKFVLVDKSKYTEEAFLYILAKVDEVGSIAFISDIKKVYAQGQYYSDFDDLKYFNKIISETADGIPTGGMIAPGPESTLKFVGKGLTNITVNSETGTIEVDSSSEGLDSQISEIVDRIEKIETTYATQEYVGENYQEILVPGEHITIDQDTNVITTYDLVDFTYLFDNYTTYGYVDDINADLQTFKQLITTNYPDKTEAREIAADEASKAVAAVVDGADDVFDTLKEISDWIVNSGQYILVTPDQIITDGSIKYYIINEDGNYVDAPLPLDESGNTEYYIYSATTAADLLSNISNLQLTVGEEGKYTYVDGDGITQEYTGDISNLIPIEGENKYTYELPEGGGTIEVTYLTSTGLFYKIEAGDAALAEEITTLRALVNSLANTTGAILYQLNSDTNTSYAYFTFDKDVWDGVNSERTIIMNIVEGKFEDQQYELDEEGNPLFDEETGEIIEHENYGDVTVNGLATTNTVNAMIDYRNGWIILKGNETLVPDDTNQGEITE